MQAESKVWDKDAVQHLIATNDKALARALWLIFQRQTTAEQSSLQTIEHNGRGFTGHDAEFLSDVARKLPRYNFKMTPRQTERVRRMMKKYWRQLLEEIEETGKPVAKTAKRQKALNGNDEMAEPLNGETVEPSLPEFEHPLYGIYAM